MKITIVGARGQLGAAMVEECQKRHDVSAFDHAALDLTDDAAVQRVVAATTPDAIVNCSGYNAVDAAEDHPLDALRVNALAVRSLARAARSADAALVHFGSDFVFDGTSPTPYLEDDEPNPRSVYATSKLLGEWFAADAPRWYVLRVESLFGFASQNGTDKGSVAGIVKSLRAGQLARVFEDRTVTPTYVPDAVDATLALLERNAPGGVYHCVNSGSCTWLEFAREAARLMSVEPKLEAVKFADAKFRAQRPLYCALSNQKLVSAGIAMPTWQDALQRYLRCSAAL